MIVTFVRTSALGQDEGARASREGDSVVVLVAADLLTDEGAAVLSELCTSDFPRAVAVPCRLRLVPG